MASRTRGRTKRAAESLPTTASPSERKVRRDIDAKILTLVSPRSPLPLESKDARTSDRVEIINLAEDDNAIASINQRADNNIEDTEFEPIEFMDKLLTPEMKEIWGVCAPYAPCMCAIVLMFSYCCIVV
jgi:hypothetical protein